MEFLPPGRAVPEVHGLDKDADTIMVLIYFIQNNGTSRWSCLGCGDLNLDGPRIWVPESGLRFVAPATTSNVTLCMNEQPYNLQSHVNTRVTRIMMECGRCKREVDPVLLLALANSNTIVYHTGCCLPNLCCVIQQGWSWYTHHVAVLSTIMHQLSLS